MDYSVLKQKDEKDLVSVVSERKNRSGNKRIGFKNEQVQLTDCTLSMRRIVLLEWIRKTKCHFCGQHMRNIVGKSCACLT